MRRSGVDDDEKMTLEEEPSDELGELAVRKEEVAQGGQHDVARNARVSRG